MRERRVEMFDAIRGGAPRVFVLRLTAPPTRNFVTLAAPSGMTGSGSSAEP